MYPRLAYHARYANVFDFEFCNKCSDTELQELGCIRHSRDRDWVEEQNFPPIHNIIFGLSPRSLAVELKKTPNAVHATDAQGRTALDWAAARAQLDDMRLLIAHGSGVNSMDITGRTTILHAVDSHSTEAVRILLEAGADPNPRMPEGLFRSSPLTAAGFGGFPDMLRLFLQFGANLDAHNPEEKTALHAAATKRDAECAAVLLESGATLEDVVGNGWTPIMTAIAHNSHAVLRLFTEWCQHRLVHVGSTACVRSSQLLPVIAEHADSETIRIVTSAVLSLPLSLSFDLGGNTCAAARGVLRRRGDYDGKLGNAFEELLLRFSVATVEEWH